MFTQSINLCYYMSLLLLNIVIILFIVFELQTLDRHTKNVMVFNTKCINMSVPDSSPLRFIQVPLSQTDSSCMMMHKKIKRYYKRLLSNM